MQGGVFRPRPPERRMEAMKFLFMQVTAMLFTVIAVFVLGAVFGAGVWVAWRGLDRRATRIKSSGEPQDDRPQRQPTPLS
jgi:hypothetical protein